MYKIEQSYYEHGQVIFSSTPGEGRGGGGGGSRLQSDSFIAIVKTSRSLFKASDTFDDFQVLIKMADSHRNCQHN